MSASRGGQESKGESAFSRAQSEFLKRREIVAEVKEATLEIQPSVMKEALDALERERLTTSENIRYNPRYGLSQLEKDIPSIYLRRRGEAGVVGREHPKELSEQLQQEFDSLEDEEYKQLTHEESVLKDERDHSLSWYAQEVLGHKPGTKEYAEITVPSSSHKLSELLEKAAQAARSEAEVEQDLQTNIVRQNGIIREKCPTFKMFIEENGEMLEELENKRAKIQSVQEAQNRAKQKVVKRHKAEIEASARKMQNKYNMD